MSLFDSKRMAPPAQRDAAQPPDDLDDNRCVDEAVRLGMIDGIILNVGCGTGQLAVALAGRCSAVTVLGVDESTRLVGLATEAAERAGLAHRVHFQAATLGSTRFKAAYFDGLISSGAIGRAVDPVALLNEMARVVKPDGAMLVRDWRRPSVVSAWWHIRWFGRKYPGSRRNDFKAEVRSAYSYSEWRRMLDESALRSSARIVVRGLTHMGIERVAQAALFADLAARREQRELLAESESWRKNL